MGLEERAATCDSQNGKGDQSHQTICKHGFSNLSHISPLVFLYLLKECYFIGKGILLLIAIFSCIFTCS